MLDKQLTFSDTASSMLATTLSHVSSYNSTNMSSITPSSSLNSSDCDDCMHGPRPSYGAIVPTDASTPNLEALQAERPGYGTCSIAGSSMNLVNAMMGTGIIGLPLAMHYCGFWVGLACSILVAWLTCSAMHLMVLTGIRTQQYSLAGLCRCIMGTAGAQIVNFILLFHTAGTAVSYYILLGDTLPGLLHHLFPLVPLIGDRQWVVICFGLFCSLPLSLSRSTARITSWSTLSVMLLPLMLLGVMVRVPAYAPPAKDIELEIVGVSPEMFKGLAIMALAFGCSQNVFGVYLSQRDQRPSRWLTASVVAIGIAFVANILFAVMGYICFGKNVQANVLLNFPVDDPAINLVRLALGVFMVLTIPLCIHPCREALLTMLSLNTDGRIVTDREHLLATIGIFTPILYYGATLTSLGKVFAVIGGLSTTALGFLLPGAAYIRVFLPGMLRGEDIMFAVATKAPYYIRGSWTNIGISAAMILSSFPIMYFSLAQAFE